MLTGGLDLEHQPTDGETRSDGDGSTGFAPPQPLRSGGETGQPERLRRVRRQHLRYGGQPDRRFPRQRRFRHRERRLRERRPPELRGRHLQGVVRDARRRRGGGRVNDARRASARGRGHGVRRERPHHGPVAEGPASPQVPPARDRARDQGVHEAATFLRRLLSESSHFRPRRPTSG